MGQCECTKRYTVLAEIYLKLNEKQMFLKACNKYAGSYGWSSLLLLNNFLIIAIILL